MDAIDDPEYQRRQTVSSRERRQACVVVSGCTVRNVPMPASLAARNAITHHKF